MADYVLSIYHDTRRKKADGVYPVKLRIYFDYKTRLYPTGIDLTKEEFERSHLAERPRSEYKDLKIKIASTLYKANEIASTLKPFNFEKFEKLMLRPKGSGTDVFHQYETTIEELRHQDRISTANSYNLSLKSLKGFLESKRKKKDSLAFEGITVQFLEEYEHWMTSNKSSLTTVGIYLRALRAIFNKAIAEGEIPKDTYPFGKRKYQIPQGRNIKKALKKEELSKLFYHSLPDNDPMAKARDFFFFSYSVNGINTKDIAELRYDNIHDDSISFVRAKTRNATKSNQQIIIAALTNFSRQIIEKYGNKKISDDTYVFDVLKQGMNAGERHRRIQAFTRFINQHIKKLAKLVGVDENISTYYARHSFTTNAIENGASMAFIQDSLGHKSIQTTMNYFKGFSDEKKKEVAEKLMDF